MLERWQTVQTNLINGKDEKSKKYREELFGKGAKYEYSEEYNRLNVLRTNVNWESIETFTRPENIHLSAKLIAQTYIDGIVETLNRHDDIMEKRLKNQMSKTAGGAT